MSRHLIDNVAVGWDELGTDLLDGAPRSLVTALTGGEQFPSRALGHVITPNGSPPVRMTVTADDVDDQDIQWGYVLREQGIEVISLVHEDCGQVVDWATGPLTAFSDEPTTWSCLATAPPIRAPRPTPAPGTPPTSPVKARSPKHR